MDSTQNGGRPSEQASRPPIEPLPFTSGVPYTEVHLPLVVDFTCAVPGEEETQFERDVSEWLKDTKAGALVAVRLGLSEVRLFFCRKSGALMGYGAIGRETWPFRDGSEITLWVLQYAGAHTNFRHLPKENINARFGKRLIAGMLREVQNRGGCKKIGLFVDPANPAKDHYRDDLNFQVLDEEQEGDRRWLRMVRPLVIS